MQPKITTIFEPEIKTKNQKRDNYEQQTKIGNTSGYTRMGNGNTGKAFKVSSGREVPSTTIERTNG
jgi:hypothetical protein